VAYGPIELGDLAVGAVAEVPPGDVVAELGTLIRPERRPDPAAGAPEQGRRARPGGRRRRR
jgi:hypothetical protein